MKVFNAEIYSEEALEQLDENEIKFPYTDKNAVYVGKYHQYELTSQYFQERGRNLEKEVDGNDPEKVKHFLADLRFKVYQYIYNVNSRTPRTMINYMIAKRGIKGYTPFEYRQAFLEAMYIEGCYLLDNGDLSSISGVDLDTMQNMSADVMRNQQRDWHKDAIGALKTLGLHYYGRYNFIVQGKQGEDW